jgi:5'-3' exonuclease
MNKMKKLIVLDWGNITHRAIFAFRNNSQVPFTYTMLRMVIGYLKRIGVTLDDKIVVAEDFGSWRKEIDKEYKAQRKAFRETKEDASWWAAVYKESNEFTEKLDLCLPWNFIKIYKMESDDIASMAVRFIEAEEKILISSDEDWQQLCVIPNVKVFSPYTKKFKIIKNPEKVLLKKIKGDISDNLLQAPRTEAEFEKRRMIVDLIHLPEHIENLIRPVIESLPIKNIALNKIPFRTCRTEIAKLYHLDE